MADVRGDVVDRLLAGDLAAGEQRRLAQAALDDSGIFDRLFAAAAAQSALLDREVELTNERGAPDRLAPPSRRLTRPAMLALAAAALVVLAVVIMRPREGAPMLDRTTAPTQTVTIPPPVLLPVPEAVRDAPFRSVETSSRTPRQSGVITSLRDGVVELDLGALDGILKDVELRVSSAQPSGGDARVAVTTVFRERSRGRVLAGTPGVGDHVNIDAGRFAAALLDEADARRSSGDGDSARTLVQTALEVSGRGDVRADVRRRAFATLGALEQQRQDWPAAERALNAAAGTFDADPAASPSQRAEVLNALGVVLIEQRNLDAAERALRTAVSVADGRTRLHVTNNLGALAALRGNRPEADSWYRQAQQLAGTSSDSAAERTTVDANLNALSGR